jgi:Na+/proline symporter
MPSESVQKLSLFALTGMVVGSIVGSGILFPPRTFGSVYWRYAEKRADTGAATIMGFVGVATLMVLVTKLPYAVFVSVGLLVSVGQLRKVMVCVKSSAA